MIGDLCKPIDDESFTPAGIFSEMARVFTKATIQDWFTVPNYKGLIWQMKLSETKSSFLRN